MSCPPYPTLFLQWVQRRVSPLFALFALFALFSTCVPVVPINVCPRCPRCSRCSQFEFDGELVRRAISATFERRKTSIPTIRPLALTPEFSDDKQKSVQWNAFLRKSNLNSNDLTLSDITARLADFLMPPAEAASQGKQFSEYWRPIDGWTETR